MLYVVVLKCWQDINNTSTKRGILTYTEVRGNSDSTGTVRNLLGPSKIQHFKSDSR